MLLPASITFLLQAVAHSLSAPRVSQVAVRAWLPINHYFTHTETIGGGTAVWKAWDVNMLPEGGFLLHITISFYGKCLVLLFSQNDGMRVIVWLDMNIKYLYYTDIA